MKILIPMKERMISSGDIKGNNFYKMVKLGIIIVIALVVTLVLALYIYTLITYN